MGFAAATCRSRAPNKDTLSQWLLLHGLCNVHGCWQLLCFTQILAVSLSSLRKSGGKKIAARQGKSDEPKSTSGLNFADGSDLARRLLLPECVSCYRSMCTPFARFAGSCLNIVANVFYRSVSIATQVETIFAQKWYNFVATFTKTFQSLKRTIIVNWIGCTKEWLPLDFFIWIQRPFSVWIPFQRSVLWLKKTCMQNVTLPSHLINTFTANRLISSRCFTPIVNWYGC